MLQVAGPACAASHPPCRAAAGFCAAPAEVFSQRRLTDAGALGYGVTGDPWVVPERAPFLDVLAAVQAPPGIRGPPYGHQRSAAVGVEAHFEGVEVQPRAASGETFEDETTALVNGAADAFQLDDVAAQHRDLAHHQRRARAHARDRGLDVLLDDFDGPERGDRTKLALALVMPARSDEADVGEFTHAVGIQCVRDFLCVQPINFRLYTISHVFRVERLPAAAVASGAHGGLICLTLLFDFFAHGAHRSLRSLRHTTSGVRDVVTLSAEHGNIRVQWGRANGAAPVRALGRDAVSQAAAVESRTSPHGVIPVRVTGIHRAAVGQAHPQAGWAGRRHVCLRVSAAAHPCLTAAAAGVRGGTQPP